MNHLRIYCHNTRSFHTIPSGQTLGELYTTLQISLPHLCVGAKVNNKAEGLNYQVYSPKDIEFVDISSLSGIRIYIRTLCFVLGMATHHLCPKAQLRIEHQISHGYYCQIPSEVMTDELIAQIKGEMKQIIAADKPFRHHTCHTSEVVQLFRDQAMFDKVDLLETSNELYSSYYAVDDFIDYHYGALLPSTGALYLFDLQRYEDGMLLVPPSRQNPSQTPPLVAQKKMMEVLREYKRYNYISGVHTVGKVNRVIQNNQQPLMMLVSEALQEKKIAAIADQIALRPELRVILIAGPSSSGKTTFTKRLSVQLYTNMLRPVSISLDNYFVPRAQTPRDANGEMDFESIYALDLPLFNSHLQQLIAGQEVALPTYNFQTGLREYRGNTLQLAPHTLLLLEGIHALNPQLTADIADSLKYKIYVSALTTVSLDDHNWIPTADNRLIRRIVRDYQFRNYSAAETIARWESVQAGEHKWVYPYQELADTMFNSAIIYELCVLKEQAEQILRQVPKDCPEYAEAYRLKRFLAYFKPIHTNDIPRTSLLREFLGGSSFEE